MEQLKNYSIIISQQFIESFIWNDFNYNSYLISFQDFDGLFKIVRRKEHEQALIGAKIMFNVNNDSTQLNKYRILGYEKIKKKSSIKNNGK